MRMMWTVLVVGLLVLTAFAGIAAWYALAVPGTPHAGPLPPLTGEERDLAVRLRRHVEAIASVPHNVDHYAALERAAVGARPAVQALPPASLPQPASPS